jgi:hypothetical protein
VRIYLQHKTAVSATSKHSLQSEMENKHASGRSLVSLSPNRMAYLPLLRNEYASTVVELQIMSIKDLNHLNLQN